MKKLTRFSRSPYLREGGAASVEFYIVSFFVFIPLLMAVLQMGLFFVAKNTVNLATFAAARAGAATGGDPTEMRKAFLRAVSPLYVGSGLAALNRSDFTDIDSGNYPLVMGGALLAAGLNLPPDQIRVLNPTRASFTDFSVPKAGGGRIIPVTNILTDSRVGGSSRQTRSDALLLKVEVQHCYHMIFPVIDRMVSGSLLLFNPLGPLADTSCYALRGVPIVSQAVVRMTNPPAQSNFP